MTSNSNLRYTNNDNSLSSAYNSVDYQSKAKKINRLDISKNNLTGPEIRVEDYQSAQIVNPEIDVTMVDSPDISTVKK